MVLVIGAGSGSSAASGSAWSWWMVDTHEHSAFSGDARADIGVDAALDKSLKYNAVFLTDHDRASSFQIQGANGNYLSFSDALSGRWSPKTNGSPTSSTNAVTTTRFHSGTSSLHVAVSASKPASAFVWAKRGPGLRAGDVTLDFWAFPQQVGTTAGADVSVSLGGDATVQTPFGYTDANNTTTLKKSTVIAWELGNARTQSLTPAADVYSNPLPYTAGVWNHYKIDVNTGSGMWSDGTSSSPFQSPTAINTLQTSDKPAPYVALTNVKIEAATNTTATATADAYFDDFTISSASPQCPADEFVYRNNLIDSTVFNGVNSAGQPFVVFPAREMGQNGHANQFNFDITDPHQYYDTYTDPNVPAGYGSDITVCGGTNISAAPWAFDYYGYNNISGTYGVQQSGYPAQLNHPGTTDHEDDVVAAKAWGADLVEVRTGLDFSSTWDRLLAQDNPIIGTYGTDAHEGVGSGEPADFISAPSPLSEDHLLHSLFEGRSYMAPNTFGGSRIIFNLDPTNTTDPYPARYPVYVSSSQLSVKVT